MDLVTVAVTVGLMALGGGLVAWPLGLVIRSKDREIANLKGQLDGTEVVVETERALEDARDLSPADELGVLLGAEPPREPPAPRDLEPGPRPVGRPAGRVG